MKLVSCRERLEKELSISETIIEVMAKQPEVTQELLANIGTIQREFLLARKIESSARPYPDPAQLRKALDHGYDPVVPPKGWFTGSVDHYHTSAFECRCIVYRRAIPVPVLEKYVAARPFFDRILVVSPRQSDFFAPKRAAADPLMIGEIGTYSFLIAYWNLVEDLKLIDEASPTAIKARRVVAGVYMPL